MRRKIGALGVGDGDDINRSGGAEPLFSLFRGVGTGARLVHFGTAGDAADRVAERVLHFRIEIQPSVFVGQGIALRVDPQPAPGVFTDELLPLGTPLRRASKGGHRRGRNRVHFMIHGEAGAADETDSGVIEIVLSPVVDYHALRVGSVPNVQVDRE